MRSAKGKLCLGLAFGIGILVSQRVWCQCRDQGPRHPAGAGASTARGSARCQYQRGNDWNGGSRQSRHLGRCNTGGIAKERQGLEEIQHHPTQLSAAGSAIALAGTGKSDAAWVKNPEWKRLSHG